MIFLLTVAESIRKTNTNVEKYLKRLESKVEKLDDKLSSIENKLTQVLAGNEIHQNELLCVTEELRLLKNHYKKRPELTKTKSALPELPLKTIGDLLVMEELLASSKDERNNLMQILGSSGGVHIRSVVNCMMRTCFTKEVSIQFSLRGKTNKRNFSKLKIYECIKG